MSDADVDDNGTVLDEVEILNLDVILSCDGESDHNWYWFWIEICINILCNIDKDI